MRCMSCRVSGLSAREQRKRASDMELQTTYAFGKTVDASFSEVEQKVREELVKEGFGIIIEFNVKTKFKEKLGRNFRDYFMLGACNPPFAWEAFAKEINIGMLLPCNVVVYWNDEDKTVVMIMDPVATLGVIGNAELSDIAGQVRERMDRFLAAV